MFDVEIQRETELIAQLKSNAPEYDMEAGRWAEVNRPFEIHFVKLRDAYWRRRMLIAKRDNLDLNQTASVY